MRDTALADSVQIPGTVAIRGPAATAKRGEFTGLILPATVVPSATVRASTAGLRVFACHRPFRSSGMHGDTSEFLYYFSREPVDGRIDMADARHDHDFELQRRDASNAGQGELFLVCGAAARTRSKGPEACTAFWAGIAGCFKPLHEG